MQFLLVAKIKDGMAKRKVLELIRPEALAAWKLYQQDIVRTLHFIDDMSGAVLMLEAPSLDAAKSAVALLPMVAEGVLIPEIIPLRPFTSFAKLFEENTKAELLKN